MKRSLCRRLNDALYGFRFGHTPRDLDRARYRRMKLLGLRMIRVRRAAAEAAPMFLDHYDGLARGASDLVDQLDHGGHRRLAAALLAQLEIDRALLSAARMRERAQIGAAGGFDQDGLQRRHAADVLADKGFGKLFEGLLEHGVLDALQYNLRVCIRHWHGFLRALRRDLSTIPSWRSIASGRGQIDVERIE